tara:strand:+ start:1639 stop:1947 length:309 start_codon:yes stop_codon:yes gene_type:complete
MTPTKLLCLSYQKMVKYILDMGTTLNPYLLAYGLRRVIIKGDRSAGDVIAMAFTANQVKTLDSLLLDGNTIGNIVTAMWSGNKIIKEPLIETYKWCIKDGRL